MQNYSGKPFSYSLEHCLTVVFVPGASISPSQDDLADALPTDVLRQARSAISRTLPSSSPSASH